MDSSSKLARKRDLVWREVDGEVVVLTQDNKQLHIFNDVGSRIWSLLDDGRRISDIASILSEEYGVGKDQVERDTLDHLEQLRLLCLLEE